MKKLFVFLTGITIISVLAGCTPKGFTPSTPERLQTNTISPDKRSYWPTKEWQVSDPEKQGMDVKALNQITSYVQDSKLNVDSVIVVRHGYIVHEKYMRLPWDKDKVRHPFLHQECDEFPGRHCRAAGKN
jgi:hypothetical protein